MLAKIVVVAIASIVSVHTFARGGGGGGMSGNNSIGLGVGTVDTSQEHMNTLIQRANTREGGITTGTLNRAYEGAAFYQYRFDGSIIALQLRPSFFYEAEDGTGASGKFEYSVIGFTVFPLLRIYPLENEFMKFYMQFGLGYGRANSVIREGPAEAKFSGGAFGTTMGLGAEFCFAPGHCLFTEGNYRYVVIERNMASSVTGTFASDSLSQAVQKEEVEWDRVDLQTRMAGLQFLFGYTFYF